MTPYLIFVIVLTIGYIIYYGYNISKDLYGKKGEATNTEEVFDMESLSEEVTATPVREMDGGFSLGNDNIVDIAPQPATEKETTNSGDKPKWTDLVDKNCEEVEAYSEGGLDSKELAEYLCRKHESDEYRKSQIKEAPRATV